MVSTLLVVLQHIEDATEGFAEMTVGVQHGLIRFEPCTDTHKRFPLSSRKALDELLHPSVQLCITSIECRHHCGRARGSYRIP